MPRMRIGLISDTHIPSMGPEPPPEVRRAFEGVDLILHAGDIYTQECIQWLEQIAPVEATTSWFSGRGEGVPRVSAPIVVEAAGRSIGLVHKLELTALADDVWPGAIEAGYPERASIRQDLQEVFGQPVDIVVFGYTHEAMVETHDDVLFVNPGSPTMVKQTRTMGTVAVMELGGDKPQVTIVELASVRD
jgi:putative phosphoesterase